MMRKNFAGLVFMVLVLTSIAVVSAVPVFGQMTATVRGVCKDTQGKPITAAVVEWTNLDNGQKYTIKTNNIGEYYSLGLAPGRYNAKLIKDGTELFHFNNVPLSPEEKVLDFDLAKELAGTGQAAGASAEEARQKQEQQAKALKENTTVKALNEKLVAAKQASDAGNYDAAIATLTEATQMDATRDLIWAKLGEAYLISGPKQTDPAEKDKRFGAAAEDYQKAIDLKQKAMDTDPKAKTPESTKI